MAKARLVSRKITRSKDMASLSSDTVRLTFILLLMTTDDFGRADGDPEMVKANCFPRDDSKTPELIESYLHELFTKRLIYRWSHLDGCQYIVFPNFDKYQRFRRDRPRRNEFPAPPEKKYEIWLSSGNQLTTNGMSTDNQRLPSSSSSTLSKDKNLYKTTKDIPLSPNGKLKSKSKSEKPSKDDLKLFSAAKRNLEKHCDKDHIFDWLRELHPSLHSKLQLFLNKSYPQGHSYREAKKKWEKNNERDKV